VYFLKVSLTPEQLWSRKIFFQNDGVKNGVKAPSKNENFEDLKQDY